MARHLMILFLAALVWGLTSPEEANKPDIEKWQGTWRAVSFISNGKSTDPAKLLAIKLTVTGTDYHFQNGDYSEHGTYRFDAAKNPKQLDIVVGDGPDKGKVHVIIYQVR